MSTPTRVGTGSDVGEEEYLPIEEVAQRLDLPLGVLIRRVEAGDVPARRTEGPDGAHYSVRLSDLGFAPERAATASNDEPESAAAGDGVELVGTPALPSSWPDKVVPAPAEELAAVSAQNSHETLAEARRVNGATPPSKPAIAPDRPQPSSEVGLVSATPRGEVANMRLDPRELVAGLLDRWERTLEQRIYAEQRQRFETELNARQNLLKQLQLELQTARAEHAAAQADKDRRLADREREIADLQREINVAKEPYRRRSWFRRG